MENHSSALIQALINKEICINKLNSISMLQSKPLHVQIMLYAGVLTFGLTVVASFKEMAPFDGIRQILHGKPASFVV